MTSNVALVSTIRHAYIALGMALAHSDEDWHLIVIDQTRNHIPDFFLTFCELNGPFKSATVRYKPNTKGIARAKERIFTNSELASFIDFLAPDRIYTGNDRRMEFQSVMAMRDQRATIGGYLDDGISSYVDIIANRVVRSFTDRYIDSPIKKLIYGKYYDRPTTFGTSKWVQELWLMFPDQLTSKDALLKALNQTWYTNDVFNKTIDSLFYGEVPGGSFDALVALPTSTVMKRLSGSLALYKKGLLDSLRGFKRIAFKYHPLNKDDPLNLTERGAVLPANIPFEIFLSRINTDVIIGDVSSSILSAKWLLPKAEVYARSISQSAYAKSTESLMTAVGVNIISDSSRLSG